MKALKLYLREVQPEWKRSEELAKVQVWALSAGLRLHGRPVVDKFELGKAKSYC